MSYYNETKANTILKAVAKTYGGTVDMFNRKDKKEDITFPRYMAIKLLISGVEGMTLQSAVLLIGRNDHTTALHALSQFSELIKYNQDFADKYQKCKELINS